MENPKGNGLDGEKLEQLVEKYKGPIIVAIVGLIFLGLGVFYFNNQSIFKSDSVEVITSDSKSDVQDSEVIVEIAGSVITPGVYRLESDSRVEDLLVACGGLSDSADRQWVDKTINRASKLTDGQKIYIPSIDEQNTVLSAKNDEDSKLYQASQGSVGSGLINVNAASQNELESLWGIGPVTAQKIIEQRPYSDVSELLTRKILKSNVYERNKDLISVY